jgi:hypothetical protein
VNTKYEMPATEDTTVPLIDVEIEDDSYLEPTRTFDLTAADARKLAAHLLACAATIDPKGD